VNFWAAKSISRATSPKWLEIDQGNLRMKFSALNVDFSSLSQNPLESRFKEVCARGCQRASKKWLFIRCCLV